MIKNTIQDFIDTEENGFIYCPACGSSMSLVREGSYEMVLTFNARNEINDLISHYRQFLSKIDRAVEIRNHGENEKAKLDIEKLWSKVKTDIPLKEGLYPAKDFSDLLYSTLDLNYITRTIRAMATLNDFDELQDVNEQSLNGKFLEAFKFVNEVIDHDLVFTPFTSLIFDQDDVRAWKNSHPITIKNGNIEGDLINLFERKSEQNGGIKTCYSFFQYMKFVAKHAEAYVQKTISNTKEEIKDNGEHVKKINDNIIRGIYLLVLLFGHESNQQNLLEGVIEFKGNKGFERASPFDLSRSVFVTPERLDEILRSYVVTSLYTRFKLSSDFIQKIKRANTESVAAKYVTSSGIRTTQTITEKGTNETDAKKRIKEDIEQYSQIVNFTCRGNLTTSEEINPNVQRDDESYEHSQYCGWYPKKEPTHSVVLIGSPGTSKSTIMLTGLTQFRRSAPTLSLNVTPTTSEELSRVVRYQNDFWNGYLPEPTKQNERLSIQLKVETTYKVDNDFKRLYFIFTDIPGETAVRSLREFDKETHPFILNILHNTETIVFIYDLSVDPNIRSQILNGAAHRDLKIWDKYEKSFKQTAEEREDNSNLQNISRLKEIPKVNIPQHDLLMKLIDDLKKVRGDLNDISFVCVIPKFDLYVDGEIVNEVNLNDEYLGEEYLDEAQRNVKFMSPFYKYLVDEKLITKTSYDNDSEDTEFAYCSCAGRESAWIENAKHGDVRIEKQIYIAHAISDKAVKSLKYIGNALGRTDSEGKIIHTGELSDAIEIGLIETLEQHFGENNVFFLPVSAQGKHIDKENSGQETQNGTFQITHPPYQKLAEYAFILPVVSAFANIQKNA